MIMSKNYNPVIVFAFSKRECEALALTLSKFDFDSIDEQDLVQNIFTSAIDALAPADRAIEPGELVCLLAICSSCVNFTINYSPQPLLMPSATAGHLHSTDYDKQRFRSSDAVASIRMES